jgi:hypothetical protein
VVVVREQWEGSRKDWAFWSAVAAGTVAAAAAASVVAARSVVVAAWSPAGAAVAEKLVVRPQEKQRWIGWLNKTEQLAGGQACETSSKKGSFPLCD